MLARCPQQREPCFLLAGGGSRWLHMPGGGTSVPRGPGRLRFPCTPAALLTPSQPPGGTEGPRSRREWERRAWAWGWGCQMNRPRRAEHGVEPRPPKEQPNGHLEGKAKARRIPAQRASRGAWALERERRCYRMPLALSFFSKIAEEGL